MEHGGEEGKTEEPTCNSARQTGWPDAQRGQAARQRHKWLQGWSGQKPQNNESPPASMQHARAPAGAKIIE
jgi:hypothetical protein